VITRVCASAATATAITFGNAPVQLRDLELIRLADAMLLDRPLDLMRVKLGDVGDFFEGKRLEFAGLEIDDLIGGHGITS
jgi:hypothetical protein